MSLEQVYANNVQHTSNFCMSVGITDFERDPLFKNLENCVLSKLKEVVSEEMKDKNEIFDTPKDTLVYFGFEDAIKELISIKNSNTFSSEK